MKYRLIILAIIFLPAVSNAEVLFSEIAWMGTTEDANNEWIEIYNFSSEPTDITGWTLSDGNSLNIILSGTMPPHGVFLLERTDDASVPGVPASIIYTGALSNSGATLTIRDPGGQIVAGPLVGGENWENIGGNNELKYTAQVTRAGIWVTGVPTPGLPNIEEDTEIVDEDEDDENNNNEPLSPPSKTSTSGGSSKSNTKPLELPLQELALKIQAPSIAYVNQSVQFKVIPSGSGKTTRNSLRYLWNFGDIHTAGQDAPTHVFDYPGEYIVVVEGSFANNILQARHEIKVVPVAFKISKTETGDILLANESQHEVNLANFTLKGSTTFTFPRMSIIKAGGTITIPKEKYGASSYVALYDTQNTLVVASTPQASPRPTVLGATRTAAQVVHTKPVEAATISVPEESSENEVQTVIKIGGEKTSEKGLASRLFARLGAFFRL